MTNIEIQTRGMAALRDALGQAGMVKFLQQIGTGDYTRDRRKWLEKTSLEDILREAKMSTKTPRTPKRKQQVTPSR